MITIESTLVELSNTNSNTYVFLIFQSYHISKQVCLFGTNSHSHNIPNTYHTKYDIYKYNHYQNLYHSPKYACQY